MLTRRIVSTSALLLAALLVSTAGADASAGPARAAASRTTAARTAAPQVAAPHVAAAAAAAAVRKVAEGQLLQLGHGTWMRVEHNALCMNVHGPTAPWINRYCETIDGPSGGTFMEGYLVGSRVLWVPVIHGPVARMTFVQGGHSYRVQLLALAGHPGWVAGYVWTPKFPLDSHHPVLNLTVFDAAGKILVRL